LILVHFCRTLFDTKNRHILNRIKAMTSVAAHVWWTWISMVQEHASLTGSGGHVHGRASGRRENDSGRWHITVFTSWAVLSSDWTCLRFLPVNSRAAQVMACAVVTDVTRPISAFQHRSQIHGVSVQQQSQQCI
jgi:purine-cytosine permease-like protein